METFNERLEYGKEGEVKAAELLFSDNNGFVNGVVHEARDNIQDTMYGDFKIIDTGNRVEVKRAKYAKEWPGLEYYGWRSDFFASSNGNFYMLMNKDCDKALCVRAEDMRKVFANHKPGDLISYDELKQYSVEFEDFITKLPEVKHTADEYRLVAYGGGKQYRDYDYPTVSAKFIAGLPDNCIVKYCPYDYVEKSPVYFRVGDLRKKYPKGSEYYYSAQVLSIAEVPGYGYRG